MRIRFGFASCSIAAAGTIAAAFGFSGPARAITETTFHYSTPQAGSITIDASTLIPLQSSLVYFFSAVGGLQNTGAGLECFGASVHFPDRAKISVVTTWYAGSANGSPSFSIGRRTLSNGNTTSVASRAANPGDTSTTYKASNASADPAVATVNNLAFTYNYVVCLPQTDRFYAARIKYTYTSAGD